jgi:hypothetical protein
MSCVCVLIEHAALMSIDEAAIEVSQSEFDRASKNCQLDMQRERMRRGWSGVEVDVVVMFVIVMDRKNSHKSVVAPASLCLVQPDSLRTLLPAPPPLVNLAIAN